MNFHATVGLVQKAGYRQDVQRDLQWQKTIIFAFDHPSNCTEL
jgi:hypothetical protein